MPEIGIALVQNDSHQLVLKIIALPTVRAFFLFAAVLALFILLVLVRKGSETHVLFESVLFVVLDVLESLKVEENLLQPYDQHVGHLLHPALPLQVAFHPALLAPEVAHHFLPREELQRLFQVVEVVHHQQ